jgi:hypothetical protein
MVVDVVAVAGLRLFFACLGSIWSKNLQSPFFLLVESFKNRV